MSVMVPDGSGAVEVLSTLHNPAICFHVTDVTMSGLLWCVVHGSDIARTLNQSQGLLFGIHFVLKMDLVQD